jgi:hypothetical protein
VSKYLFDRFSYSDFDKSKGGSVGSRSSFKAPAFKAVMEDKILMSSFRAYCESVHKTEFLEFLEKVFIFVRVRFFFFFLKKFVVFGRLLCSSRKLQEACFLEDLLYGPNI